MDLIFLNLNTKIVFQKYLMALELQLKPIGQS